MKVFPLGFQLIDACKIIHLEGPNWRTSLFLQEVKRHWYWPSHRRKNSRAKDRTRSDPKTLKAISVVDDPLVLIEAERAFFPLAQSILELFFISLLSFNIIIEVKEVLTFLFNLTSNNDGAIHKRHRQNLYFAFSNVLSALCYKSKNWSFWALTLQSWMSNKSSFTRFLIIQSKFCKGRIEVNFNFVGFH